MTYNYAWFKATVFVFCVVEKNGNYEVNNYTAVIIGSQ